MHDDKALGPDGLNPGFYEHFRNLCGEDILISCNEWLEHCTFSCMKSIRFQILINDDQVGPINPWRGLWQGDPLSPYMFILGMEGHSGLFRKAKASGDFHEVQICRNASCISHLMFANDCFIFFGGLRERIKSCS
uniref:Uncharacterized protein n=1 Tax=Cajanus cajan TaxID=3821 RepID=A0A151S8N8_CAJCA|nr:hypothetical protein KK1_026994 [Cajanus cajan]